MIYVRMRRVESEHNGDNCPYGISSELSCAYPSFHFNFEYVFH